MFESGVQLAARTGRCAASLQINKPYGAVRGRLHTEHKHTHTWRHAGQFPATTTLPPNLHRRPQPWFTQKASRHGWHWVSCTVNTWGRSCFWLPARNTTLYLKGVWENTQSRHCCCALAPLCVLNRYVGSLPHNLVLPLLNLVNMINKSSS